MQAKNTCNYHTLLLYYFTTTIFLFGKLLNVCSIYVIIDMYNLADSGCDFSLIPLVYERGDAHEYCRSSYFVDSNICGSVLHR